MASKKEGENGRKAKEIADEMRYNELYTLNTDKFILLVKNLYKIVDDLKAQAAIYDKKIAKLERENQELRNTDDLVVKYKGYDKVWARVEKIVFVLSRNKKPMLTHEIERELLLIEPTIEQSTQDTFKSISKAVYQAVKLGRAIQYKKIGAGGFVYALPEWFDGQGNLLPKFRR